MDLRSEFRISARREAVWTALVDEGVLTELVPGMKSIEKAGENDRTVKVMLKVGTLRPTIRTPVVGSIAPVMAAFRDRTLTSQCDLVVLSR